MPGFDSHSPLGACIISATGVAFEISCACVVGALSGLAGIARLLILLGCIAVAAVVLALRGRISILIPVAGGRPYFEADIGLMAFTVLSRMALRATLARLLPLFYF